MNQFFKNVRLTVQKYNIVIFFAILLSITAIYTIENENTFHNMVPWVNVILVVAFCIPLFIGLFMFLKYKTNDNAKNSVFFLLGLVLATNLYFSLPMHESEITFSPYIRFAIFFLVCHLWVVVAPIFYCKNDLDLWNYNKVLLINFIFSVIVSFIISSGLNFGLIATKLLLDFNYNPKLHAELVIVVFSIMNTLLFLSKIPEKFFNEGNTPLVSKGFYNVFRFVLMPLLGLYVLILVAYIFKIMIEWQLPQGIVAYLILGISIFGIICFLLVYPFVLENDYQWIKKVQKYYYILLLPLILLLFIAIQLRINQYGITINRYIIFALGVWLFMVVCAALLKWRLIKMIPVSFMIISVLSCIGPWGMFTLSEVSQVKRLQTILESSNMLVNHKLTSEVKLDFKNNDAKGLDSLKDINDDKLSRLDRLEALSIIKYLAEFHGFKKIQPWFRQNLDSLYLQSQHSTNFKDYSKRQIVFMGIGIDNNEIQNNEDLEDIYNFEIKDMGHHIEDINGYDERLEIKFDEDNLQTDFNSIFVSLNSKAMNVEVAFNSKQNIIFDLKAKFDSSINKIEAGKTFKSFDIEALTFKHKNGKIEAKLLITSARIVKGEEGIEIKELQGALLLKRVL
ncbi:MAG: DUF4153 domain-containing protein [Alphaproteobacteria bacterium]|nr:DUF4153 domain-containing protein [Alphaproteobacteria bacterium]